MTMDSTIAASYAVTAALCGLALGAALMVLRHALQQVTRTFEIAIEFMRLRRDVMDGEVMDEEPEHDPPR